MNAASAARCQPELLKHGICPKCYGAEVIGYYKRDDASQQPVQAMEGLEYEWG